MSIELLTFQQDGIFFFTHAATGESGLSVSGLAKLCGVDQSTISRLIKKQFESGIEELQEVVQQNFVLVNHSDDKAVDGVNPGKLTVYNSKLCVAVISHYAGKGKKEAIFSLVKFAQMGFNTWIQGITGWENPASQAIAPRQQRSLPGSQLLNSIESADDLPEDVREQNRREMYRAIQPGTLENLNCNSIGRMLRQFEPPGESLEPISKCLQEKFGQN